VRFARLRLQQQQRAAVPRACIARRQGRSPGGRHSGVHAAVAASPLHDVSRQDRSV